MGNPIGMLLLVMLLSSWRLMASEETRGSEEEATWPGSDEKAVPFLLRKSEQVVRTEAGEVRVVRGFGSGGGGAARRWSWGGAGPAGLMHIGFIYMEPKTLFIPQYLDSSLILFVRKGEVRVGWIHKDGLVEKQLKMGDIIRIPSGSTFYMVNVGKGQRLQLICSIDASESLGFSPYQSFFIGGGRHPSSVLAGFDIGTLVTAFNTTSKEVQTILESQTGGPIMYYSENATEHGDHRRERSARKRDLFDLYHGCDEEQEAEQSGAWSWRRLLSGVLWGESNLRKKGPVRSPDPYNLYDRKPDFSNDYGWSTALDEHDYAPLAHADIGVYVVNLAAGSMLAPHVNPKATEYGVVLRGSGTIQVVLPNGTSAMNAEVNEGDVFWIPQFFPFCQIASRSGPLEFFGFTTSARKNRPQFLVGSSSVLAAMMGPELAAGFGVSEERLRRIVGAQKEAVILPSWPARERKEERGWEREADA